MKKALWAIFILNMITWPLVWFMFYVNALDSREEIIRVAAVFMIITYLQKQANGFAAFIKAIIDQWDVKK